jgi:hypothetical protein
MGSEVNEIGSEAFLSCTHLQSLTIPGTVTLVGESAFENCSMLLIVSLPDSVETIGEQAFKGSGLRVINLPDSDIALGKEAFAQSNLRTIKLPSKISSLPAKLLYKCTKLRELICEGNVKCQYDSTFKDTPLAQENLFKKIIKKGTYCQSEPSL